MRVSQYLETLIKIDLEKENLLLVQCLVNNSKQQPIALMYFFGSSR